MIFKPYSALKLTLKVTYIQMILDVSNHMYIPKALTVDTYRISE